jgi:hypothetical protein
VGTPRGHKGALRLSLEALTTPPTDAAAIRLAFAYAAALDDDGDVDRIGPLYLAVLDALGLTPKGRANLARKGATTDGAATSPLDELRARRASRAN